MDDLESTPRRHKKPKNRLGNCSIQSEINGGVGQSLGPTVPGMHGECYLAPPSTPEGEKTGCEQQCCTLLGYIAGKTRDARCQPIRASRLPGIIWLERVHAERGSIVHPVAVLSSKLDHYIREVVSSQYLIHLHLSLNNNLGTSIKSCDIRIRAAEGLHTSLCPSCNSSARHEAMFPHLRPNGGWSILWEVEKPGA